ncbi:MAG: hypothetical protein QG567_1769 [Campylobacterota bacterium]|nr:hypothetical protein [Campylobacterota bacterium]
MHTENIKKIKEMFELQQKLNDETNGSEWIHGTTKHGKQINWKRCIHLEGAEFIGSFPWKHWKNIEGEADWDNAKIELVDIWHFLMSEIIRTESYSSLESFYKHIIFNTYTQTQETKEQEKILAVMEKIINEATTPLTNLNVLSRLFFEACALIGLSLDELYAQYIGKNALNKFRQDNGYKEGTYIKIWNGKEDNAVMQSIIAAEPFLSFEQLLFELHKSYEAAKGE